MLVGENGGNPRARTAGHAYIKAHRLEELGSHMGEPLTVREVVGGLQWRRTKVDEPSSNGPDQSRPRLGEGFMEVQVDMQGGEMIRVEVV